MPLFPWSPNPARDFARAVAADTGPIPRQGQPIERGSLSQLLDPPGYDDELIEWTDRQLDVINGALFLLVTGTQPPKPGPGAREVIGELLAEVESRAAGEDGVDSWGPQFLDPED